MQEDAGGRQRSGGKARRALRATEGTRETRVFPMIIFLNRSGAAPPGGGWPRRLCVMQESKVFERGAFLVPFGHSQRSLFCAAAQGLGHRREASALWAVAHSAKRPEGGERNERWARPAPSATIERPGVCPKPRQARREACALWALGPKAQSDPKRGSETMSATGREARMIEQPGRPLHPIHSPCLPSLSQYSGKTCSNRSPYLSGSPPANVSRRA